MLIGAALVYTVAGPQAEAQLAITEAMSWASTNCAGCPETGNRGCRPDFWELTNFGTNTIDLTGYLFVDKDEPFPDGTWTIGPTTGPVSIKPNESIIFVREGWDDVPDAAAFRHWWGESNLPSDLQIYFYPQTYGFDNLGDAVRLGDANSNLVDQVYFGETRRGFTFTYDTNCGGFVQSELGVCGAFQAAICGDVGSPGKAPCGPVPLRITEQPVCQTNDAGSDVVLHVRACGLPRPRYQWYFNGAPLAAAVGTVSSVPRLVGFAGCGPAWMENPVPPDLTIPNVQPRDAGEYFVEVFNGLEKLTSAVVRLTVNTNLSPIRLECPPLESCIPAGGDLSPPGLTVAPMETAVITVNARGYPPPTFQWSWSADGTSFVEIPGETNRTLTIVSAQTKDAGIYRVRVQNSVSVTNAFTRLIVKAKPRLKITEVMSDECFEPANDWWELTNMGDEPVNLCGYRWDDAPGNIGSGPTITNAAIIQPGESVILVEGMTPEFFINWWGASNLPPGLQIIRYTANGLESDGDEISIWNPTASRDSNFVDTVVFSGATRGASFWFDFDACTNSEFGVASASGQCGAFRSAQGCDIGSPGWTRWTPPRLTSIRREDPLVMLEWKAQPGSTTVVQYAREIATPPDATIWNDLGTYSFAGATCTTTDATIANGAQRFYRVKLQSPAVCLCPAP